MSGKNSEDTYEADILILCASSHAVTALLAAIHLRSFAVSRLGIGSFANFCVRFHAARSRTSGAVFRKTCAAAVALSSKCSASGWSGMSAQAASSRPAYGGARGGGSPGGSVAVKAVHEAVPSPMTHCPHIADSQRTGRRKGETRNGRNGSGALDGRQCCPPQGKSASRVRAWRGSSVWSVGTTTAGTPVVVAGFCGRIRESSVTTEVPER